MVKLCFLCAALLSALLAIGCAGEAEITPEPALKGDYLTGTLRFLEDSPFGSVQAPAIANLLEADDVEIFTSSPIASTLAHSEEGYVLLTNGTVMTVGVDRQQLPTGLHVTIRNGDQPIAIAELAYAMFPELGDSVIVPEAGDYEGELLIISNGRAVGLGSVTATVDPDHDWTAIASGGGDWLGHGFFTGAFRPDGTLADAMLLINGSVMEEPTPAYSYDGETLIVRYDGLPLSPASAWLVLHPIPSVGP